MENQSNMPSEKVWLSREEYTRLKELEPKAATPITQSFGSETEKTAASTQPVAALPEAGKSKFSRTTIVTGVFAVLSFVFPQFIILFLIAGIVSFVQFLNDKSVSNKRKASTLGIGLLILIPIIIFVAPFLLLFAVVIFWQLGCWTGLGSCTTA